MPPIPHVTFTLSELSEQGLVAKVVALTLAKREAEAEGPREDIGSQADGSTTVSGLTHDLTEYISETDGGDAPWVNTSSLPSTTTELV